MRHALRSELDTVVDIWVDAFADDSYLRWIQPEDAQWPEFGRAWMRFVAEATFERGHTYLSDNNDAAVAWIPPDLSLLSPDAIGRGRSILAEFGGESRAQDAFEMIMQARTHDLPRPHWTLQYLGVRSAAQGTGRGAAVVAPTLARIDKEGRECGLVSTTSRNVSFYQRLGFIVAAEISGPDTTVTLRPMHRPASPRGRTGQLWFVQHRWS